MHFEVYELRFWLKIDWPSVKEPGDCWPWAGAKSRGYGGFRVKKQRFSAHRFEYELLIGPIPDGLTLDHLCRNPSCVNPGHLEPVTQAENNRRKPQEVRERVAAATRTPCTCGRAKEKTGMRYRCRACQREREAARYQRLKARAAAAGMTVAEWREARRRT